MNEIPNPIKERLNFLEVKVDNLIMGFEKCLGVSLDSESNMNAIPLKNKAITVSLISELEGIEDYEVALKTLNQLGNARGVEFKKGIQKQNKGEAPYEKSIICIFTDRNKAKHGS